jgi:surface protein
MVNEWITNKEVALENYGDINTWNTSQVTDMSTLFNGRTTFNDDISKWNTSNVTTMQGMFTSCGMFNINIDTHTVEYNLQTYQAWDTSKVTNMEGMFTACDMFNQNLNNWTTTAVTNMRQMFDGCDEFNGNISLWDTSSVTNMEKMFQWCVKFNSDISLWKTLNVANMNDMFYKCSLFNQDITNWQTNNVTTMDSMFESCLNFNYDIRFWTITSIINTGLVEMFYSANAFLNEYNQTVDSISLLDASGTPVNGFFDVSDTPINDISVSIGWNLIHITADGKLSGQNITSIYKYDNVNNNYVVVNFDNNSNITVATNSSYLIECNSTDNIIFTTILYNPTDLDIFNFTDNKNITVITGWNVIGWNSTDSTNLATIIDTSNIIIENTLHEYNVDAKNRFGTTTTINSIKSNRGYWVKCSNSGILKMNKNE